MRTVSTIALGYKKILWNFYLWSKKVNPTFYDHQGMALIMSFGVHVLHLLGAIFILDLVLEPNLLAFMNANIVIVGLLILGFGYLYENMLFNYAVKVVRDFTKSSNASPSVGGMGVYLAISLLFPIFTGLFL